MYNMQQKILMSVLAFRHLTTCDKERLGHFGRQFLQNNETVQD